MDAFFSLIFYFAVVSVTILVVSKRYNKTVRLTNGSENNFDYTKKISLFGIAFFSFLFVIYNVFVTVINPSTTGDRRNYALNFYGYRSSSSVGLTFVINIVKMLSSNVETLYYVTTFVVLAITLFAYKISKEATPYALLFLFSTQYVFFSFEGLKQSYANAFAVLCICLALRSKTKKDDVIGILLILLAIIFHPTGYLLLPLYIMLKFRKTKKTVILFFIILIVFVLFLEPILIFVSSTVAPIAPVLSHKILQYFGEDASERLQTEGSLAIVKGIPYYILTVTGWVKRKSLIGKIDNYDNYLFLSGALSVIYLATVYNAWVYRFAYFLYFAEGVFYALLIRNVSNKNNRIILNVLTIGAIAVITIRFVILMYVNQGGF